MNPADRLRTLAVERRERGAELLDRDIASERHLGLALAEFVAWDEANVEAFRPWRLPDDVAYDVDERDLDAVLGDAPLRTRVDALRGCLTDRLARLDRVGDVELGAGASQRRSTVAVVGSDAAQVEPVVAVIRRIGGIPVHVVDRGEAGDPGGVLSGRCGLTAAVVVLSPDDAGSDPARRRVQLRPANWVVLALGVLAGALGPDRVLVVRSDHVRTTPTPAGCAVVPDDAEQAEAAIRGFLRETADHPEVASSTA